MRGVKRGRLSGGLLVLVAALPAGAHELAPGDILYARGDTVETARTRELTVTLAPNAEAAHYRVDLARPEGDPASHLFEPMIPVGPYLDTVSEKRFCDRQMIAVTLRYGWPAGADWFAPNLETHLFDSETLAFIETAPGAPDEIAPYPDEGTERDDAMPQPVHFICEPRLQFFFPE